MARLKHVAITTQDPQETSRFYKEAFELDEVGKINSELVEGFFLSDGHINIAILKFKDERVAGKEFGTSYTGLHHIGFEVDNMAETAGKLENLNSSPRSDINEVLNPAMKDINAGIEASMKDMVGGHGGRNVEVKFSGPDGVMIDISQTGWVGTGAE